MGLMASMIRKSGGLGGAVSWGTGIYFAQDTYNESREQGKGVLASAADAGMDAAMGFLLKPKGYFAMQALAAAPQTAANLMRSYGQWNRHLSQMAKQQAFQNASFSDTEQTYTMRQAGMAIAQRSRYNTQQAMLGNEAKYMLK